jgi:hypothetical protein
MKRVCLALVATLQPLVAHAGPPAWARPVPPLPMLPSVSRVRIEAARDHVTVVQEVLFPRGDWQRGGLDLYVAFGSPGTPIAVDAFWVGVAPDANEPSPDAMGDALSVDRAAYRAASTQPLLGPPQMAGVVVHVKEADLRRAYATSELAALRVRSLLAPPTAAGDGERQVVVRLGIAGGLPLTLGSIQVVSRDLPPVVRAEAVLCGPDADPHPLAVSLGSPLAPPRATATSAESPIVPAVAVRHASDDLCVRWWSRP